MPHTKARFPSHSPAVKNFGAYQTWERRSVILATQEAEGESCTLKGSLSYAGKVKDSQGHPASKEKVKKKTRDTVSVYVCLVCGRLWILFPAF